MVELGDPTPGIHATQQGALGVRLDSDQGESRTHVSWLLAERAITNSFCYNGCVGRGIMLRVGNQSRRCRFSKH